MHRKLSIKMKKKKLHNRKFTQVKKKLKRKKTQTEMIVLLPTLRRKENLILMTLIVKICLTMKTISKYQKNRRFLKLYPLKLQELLLFWFLFFCSYLNFAVSIPGLKPISSIKPPLETWLSFMDSVNHIMEIT